MGTHAAESGAAGKGEARILFLRLGAVGDVVRCLPALEAVRTAFPGGHLAWLAEPGPGGILQGHPALDDLIVFPRRQARGPWSRVVRETVRRLRESRFDITLDFHGILKSGYFSRASRAPHRIAFGPPLAREWSHWFATETVRGSHPWRVRQFLSLVEPLTGPVSEVPAIRLPLDREERDRVDAFFASEGLGRQKLVVLYPGSSAGAAWKRWPADRYALVGQRLLAAGAAEVLVAWGPGEESLAREVAEGGTRKLRLCPPTSLRELAEILRRADLVICPDTGPAHLAGAGGTPVLGIYGPSPADRNRPPGEGHEILTEGPPTRPRPWNRSILAERMRAITAHQVYDAAARMLGAF